MKRARIIVKGRVQRVGYRDEVEEIARRLGIKGFVENIKPYDIRIVTEGEDEAISEFIERIKIKRFPIDVESVEVSFEDFKGEFEYFEIKRGNWQEELGERLDTAGKLLYKSVELAERSVELSERSVELGEESVSIGKKMLEKQDETINEIKGLREDLKSYMEERFDRLEHEVMAIKAKLGMV
ncbi:MAG: acylphosphatase [Candidatus Methanophagaceae archaeon]|nr:MAG: acylphosphatase [Methanophagales archaeon]